VGVQRFFLQSGFSGEICGELRGKVGVGGGICGKWVFLVLFSLGLNPGPSSVEERAYRRSHVQRARGGT
jgi:hypothetical protein